MSSFDRIRIRLRPLFIFISEATILPAFSPYGGTKQVDSIQIDNPTNNAHVVPSLWRGLIAAFIGVLLGGFVMSMILAGGAANPPIAGTLQVDLNDLSSLTATPLHLDEAWTLHTITESIVPPFTFIGSAAFDQNDLWGLWIDWGTRSLPFVVHPDGYIAIEWVKPDYRPLDLAMILREFPHVRPTLNTLRIHVDSGGKVLSYIQNEITMEYDWDESAFPQSARLGVLTHSDEPIWRSVQVYSAR